MMIAPGDAFQSAQSAALLVGIGLLLTLSGLSHWQPGVNDWDMRTFQFLHIRLRRYAGLFGYIWPLGTTPVTILLVLTIFISGRQPGLLVLLCYLLAAILEWAIKQKVKRPRPFETLPDVVISQPKKPHDPSHPSGDSMRVWFLALVFPLALGLPWPVFAFTSITAGILSLGRIGLGVHYPLDVAGGAGLGLLATGLASFSYQFVITI